MMTASIDVEKRNELAQLLPKNSIIYCWLKHRSRGGAVNTIGAFVIERGDPGSPTKVSLTLGGALGFVYDPTRQGFIVLGDAYEQVIRDRMKHLSRDLFEGDDRAIVVDWI